MKEIEFLSPLDNQNLNCLRVRLITENGELIDIMFQFESLINTKWTPIVWYDCAPGFFHRDVLHPNGDKEKQLIELDSLKSASNYAEQDLKDRWEWYKRDIWKN